MSHTDPLTHSLADEVRAIPGGEFMDLCVSCGTCTSQCMIQRKQDLGFNPRRLFHKALIGLEQDAFDDVSTWLCTACDLCYPACPQKIHISGVISAIRSMAVQSGSKSLINPAKVNEQTCVACSLCVQVCPYEAIQIQDKKVPYRGFIPVASVDPTKCMACGLCGAVCRSNSIGIEQNYADAVLVGNLWEWLNPTAEVTL